MPQVFEAVDTANNDKCVIKVLKPILEVKIKREIKVLRNLCGAPNVVALLDVVEDRELVRVLLNEINTDDSSSVKEIS